jgi:uncharacterized protein (TIGR02996 family)
MLSVPLSTPDEAAMAAIGRRLTSMIVSQPPVFTKSPSKPFGRYGESVDDPSIAGLLVVKDVDGRMWTARWVTRLSHYPHEPVTVQIVGNAVATGNFPGQPYRAVSRGQRLEDWSRLLPFVLEIAENPGDRDRRLIYADYLDDIGEVYAADSLRSLILRPHLAYEVWWETPVLSRPVVVLDGEAGA